MKPLTNVTTAVLLLLSSAVAFATPLDEARALVVEGKRTEALALIDATPDLSKNVQAQVLKIYALTDTQQFKLAISVASAQVEAHKESAALNLARAYALRHSGAKTEALSAYQEVARLDPGNKDAMLGQVLMLQSIGAPVMAYDLARKNNVELSRDTLADIRHAQALQIIRAAPTEGEFSAERKSSLEKAIQILRELSAENSGRTPDLIAALSRNGQHEEALSLFEALQAKKAAPAWLGLDVANSYVAQKKYVHALDLMEIAYAQNPQEHEIWSTLFYMYADTYQMGKAQVLMDTVVAQCEASRCGDLNGARALQVYSRLWASDVAGARELAVTGLTANPTSIDLKSAYIATLQGAGLRGAARIQAKAFIAQSPEILDFKITELLLQDPLAPATEFATRLKYLEANYPGNAQLARARADWGTRRAAQVTVDHRSEFDDTSAVHKTVTSVSSSALNDQGLKVVADVTRLAYSLTNVAAGQLDYGSIGLVVPVNAGSSLTAKAGTFNGAASYGLNLSHIASDAWRFDVEARTNSDALPIKGLLAGSRQDSLAGGATYRLSDTRELGVSLTTARNSDGNNAVGGSLHVTQSGAATPDWVYQWTNRIGVDTNSRQDVAYFAPARSSYAETEMGVTRRWKLGGDKSLAVKPHVSLGVSAQEGFATLPLGTVGVGLNLTSGETFSLDTGLDLQRKSFDGQYSTIAVLGFTLTWYWY